MINDQWHRILNDLRTDKKKHYANVAHCIQFAPFTLPRHSSLLLPPVAAQCHSHPDRIRFTYLLAHRLTARGRLLMVGLSLRAMASWLFCFAIPPAITLHQCTGQSLVPTTRRASVIDRVSVPSTGAWCGLRRLPCFLCLQLVELAGRRLPGRPAPPSAAGPGWRTCLSGRGAAAHVRV